jgi:hypothetical protein
LQLTQKSWIKRRALPVVQTSAADRFLTEITAAKLTF